MSWAWWLLASELSIWCGALGGGGRFHDNEWMGQESGFRGSLNDQLAPRRCYILLHGFKFVKEGCGSRQKNEGRRLEYVEAHLLLLLLLAAAVLAAAAVLLLLFLLLLRTAALAGAVFLLFLSLAAAVLSFLLGPLLLVVVHVSPVHVLRLCSNGVGVERVGEGEGIQLRRMGWDGVGSAATGRDVGGGRSHWLLSQFCLRLRHSPASSAAA